MVVAAVVVVVVAFAVVVVVVAFVVVVVALVVVVDNKLLQEMIVEKGLAEVKYVYADYMYTSKLEVLESKAKDRKIGMWSDNDDIDLIIYIIGGIMVILISIYGRKLSKK